MNTWKWRHNVQWWTNNPQLMPKLKTATNIDIGCITCCWSIYTTMHKIIFRYISETKFCFLCVILIAKQYKQHFCLACGICHLTLTLNSLSQSCQLFVLCQSINVSQLFQIFRRDISVSTLVFSKQYGAHVLFVSPSFINTILSHNDSKFCDLFWSHF